MRHRLTCDPDDDLVVGIQSAQAQRAPLARVPALKELPVEFHPTRQVMVGELLVVPRLEEAQGEHQLVSGVSAGVQGEHGAAGHRALRPESCLARLGSAPSGRALPAPLGWRVTWTGAVGAPATDKPVERGLGAGNAAHSLGAPKRPQKLAGERRPAA